MKILEVLRLTEKGHSQREIAKSVSCSKSTVGVIQKRCPDINLCYEEANGMTRDAVSTDLEWRF